jgi:DNA ligase 1
MPSPAKKRKLDTTPKAGALPSRGLEYFFSKQKQNVTSKDRTASAASSQLESAKSDMTDEELARKLQAEWDQEMASDPPTDRDAIPQASKIGLEVSQDLAGFDAAPENSGPLADAIPIPQENTLSLQSFTTLEDSVSTTIPLDESPLTFDPSSYTQRIQQGWPTEGGGASYALLTRCFVLVNGTTSRIKIVDTLVNFIRVLIESDPSSLLPAVSHHCNVYRYSLQLTALGLAGNQCDLATIYILGTWTGRLGHLKGSETSVRA